MVGVDPGTYGRRPVVERGVRGLLEREAALEPPARPLGLELVGRQVLVPHEAHADRRDGGEEGAAAQVAPARTDAAHDPCSVPGADLAEVDAGSQRRRQVVHEGSEVHPLGCGVVDRHKPSVLARVVVQVDPHDAHRKPVLGDEGLRDLRRLRLERAVARVALESATLAGPAHTGSGAPASASASHTTVATSVPDSVGTSTASPTLGSVAPGST